MFEILQKHHSETCWMVTMHGVCYSSRFLEDVQEVSEHRLANYATSTAHTANANCSCRVNSE